MRNYTFNLSVLLLRQGDLWAAQCLEYDIAAQGRTIADAKRAFEKTFVGQVVLDLVGNREPLEGFTSAPHSYWTRFETAERLTDRRPLYVPEALPPAFMIAAAVQEMRIEG